VVVLQNRTFVHLWKGISFENQESLVKEEEEDDEEEMTMVMKFLITKRKKKVTIISPTMINVMAKAGKH